MQVGHIAIIIVDDHAMIRKTWKMVLEQDERLKVIAECASGAEVIEKVATVKPDIILMDINMSPVNGFEATQAISQTDPDIKIIGISINNQPSYARHMLQCGAKGYVTKNSSREEMITAILEVHGGGTYICEEVKRNMDNQP